MSARSISIFMTGMLSMSLLACKDEVRHRVGEGIYCVPKENALHGVSAFWDSAFDKMTEHLPEIDEFRARVYVSLELPEREKGGSRLLNRYPVDILVSEFERAGGYMLISPNSPLGQELNRESTKHEKLDIEGLVHSQIIYSGYVMNTVVWRPHSISNNKKPVFDQDSEIIAVCREFDKTGDLHSDVDHNCNQFTYYGDLSISFSLRLSLIDYWPDIKDRISSAVGGWRCESSTSSGDVKYSSEIR